MKMVICLHGNPLQGQEFDPLLPILTERGFNAVVHKRPIKGSKMEPLLQSINATAKVSGGSPFSLVAYSWGAYLALAYLNRFPENVTSLLLINPLVVDRHLPSAATNVWMKIPLIRSLLLKLKSRSMTADYMKSIFAPQEQTQEAKLALEPYLLQGQVWRGAMAYKKLMIASPIIEGKASEIPVKVLFGENDDIAPYQEQKSVIERFGAFEEAVIPEAGHALPWTHRRLIVDEINRLLNKKVKNRNG